jgi:hypothetical protein
MATYYPCKSSQASAFCTLCFSTQSNPSSCTSSSSKNTSGNSLSCSAYCNTGCNSTCNTAQTICVVHSQYIKDHSDVGAYPGKEVNSDDFIYKHWTANYWNSLIKKLNDAEDIGYEVSQKSSGKVSVDKVNKDDVITAKFYNDIRNKLCNFNVSYDTVSQNQLITATIANAVKTAYENAKFNSNVCDACNTDQTSRGGCSCNCSCSCSCNCGCSCGPSCSCNAPKNATTV